MSTKLELGVLESLHDVHENILKERTGGLVRFAETLYLTPSTLKRRIDMLKILGADVRFDKIRKTYYYNNIFIFDFNVEARERDN